MFKRHLKNIPPFYQTYIDLIDENEDLCSTLKNGGIACWRKDMDKLNKLGLRVYEEGKWTVPQLIQHTIDTERIFAFRALAAARREKAIIPGYNEDSYADWGRAGERSIEVLLEELETLRKATWLMFQSFTPSDFSGTINANNTIMSPVEIGFILVGHARHHFNIVEERYFKLL